MVIVALQARRRAFTRMEVAVLIGLALFLLALFMPCVSGSREAARRSSCQCSLKQWGLALHNYNDVNGRLPSGFASRVFGGTDASNWGSTPPMNRVGWQVRVLPFMEQSGVYDQLNWSLADPSQRVYNQQLKDGLPARQHHFSATKCASDPFPSINPQPLTAPGLGPASLRHFAVGSYEGSMGSQQLESAGGCLLGAMGDVAGSFQAASPLYNQFAQGGRSFPRVDSTQPGMPFTNALNGILPADRPANDPAAQPLIEQLSGVFSANGYGIRFDEATDGLSNTIFLGEVLPECTGAFQAGGWPMIAHRPTNVPPGSNVTYTGGAPGASTIIPINTFVTCPKIKTPQKEVPPFGGSGSSCVNNINGAAAFGFKSRHPGICQFVFGDGSVRMLNERIDHGVYQLLGAKSDGVTISCYE